MLRRAPKCETETSRPDCRRGPRARREGRGALPLRVGAVGRCAGCGAFPALAVARSALALPRAPRAVNSALRHDGTVVDICLAQTSISNLKAIAHASRRGRLARSALLLESENRGRSERANGRPPLSHEVWIARLLIAVAHELAVLEYGLLLAPCAQREARKLVLLGRLRAQDKSFTYVPKGAAMLIRVL